MKEILTKELDLSPSQLYVSDLSKLTEYYSNYAGLQILESSGSRSILGHKDTPIIELVSKKIFSSPAMALPGYFTMQYFSSLGEIYLKPYPGLPHTLQKPSSAQEII